MPEGAVEVLLAEDDPENLDLMIGTLCNENICDQIRVAQDGREALDFLFSRDVYGEGDRGSQPRLIVLDLRLPKLNGLEVLERIRSDPRTRAIPVVIFTSSTQEHDLSQAYSLGASSYVNKPADFDQFQATFARVAHYWLVINQPPPVATFDPRHSR